MAQSMACRPRRVLPPVPERGARFDLPARVEATGLPPEERVHNRKAPAHRPHNTFARVRQISSSPHGCEVLRSRHLGRRGSSHVQSDRRLYYFRGYIPRIRTAKFATCPRTVRALDMMRRTRSGDISGTCVTKMGCGNGSASQEIDDVRAEAGGILKMSEMRYLGKNQ